jgi:hypothetical protein
MFNELMTQDTSFGQCIGSCVRAVSMHRMLLVYRLNNLRAGDLKGESLCFDTAG